MMRLRRFLWCVFLITLSLANLTRAWQIEHLFVDDLALDKIDGDASPSDVADPTPMLFKCVGSCDRQGIVSGVRIVISGCRWPSINGRQFVLEATSGWFFVLEEAPATDGPTNDSHHGSLCGMPKSARLRPVRPTEEEFRTLFDNNERGYLTRKSAGTFTVVTGG